MTDSLSNIERWWSNSDRKDWGFLRRRLQAVGRDDLADYCLTDERDAVEIQRRIEQIARGAA